MATIETALEDLFLAAFAADADLAPHTRRGLAPEQREFPAVHLHVQESVRQPGRIERYTITLTCVIAVKIDDQNPAAAQATFDLLSAAADAALAAPDPTATAAAFSLLAYLHENRTEARAVNSDFWERTKTLTFYATAA